MAYEQNEWVTDMDNANAPTEEPDQLQEMLEAYDERQRKAVKEAHSSWLSTKVMLESLPFEVQF